MRNEPCDMVLLVLVRARGPGHSGVQPLLLELELKALLKAWTVGLPPPLLPLLLELELELEPAPLEEDQEEEEL